MNKLKYIVVQTHLGLHYFFYTFFMIRTSEKTEKSPNKIPTISSPIISSYVVKEARKGF